MIEESTSSRTHHFYQNVLHLTRVHLATFYQSALRHEQHEDVTPSFRVDSGLSGENVCSD